MNAMTVIQELLTIVAEDYTSHAYRKAQVRMIIEFAKRHENDADQKPVVTTANGTEVDDIPF